MAEPEPEEHEHADAGGLLHGVPEGAGGPGKRKRDRQLAIAALVVGVIGALLAFLTYRRAQSSTAQQSYSGGYGAAPTTGTGVVPGSAGYDAAQGTYDQAIINALAALNSQIQGLGQMPQASAPPTHATVPPQPNAFMPGSPFEPLYGTVNQADPNRINNWGSLSMAPHAQSPAQAA